MTYASLSYADTFAAVVKAAFAGERCPTREEGIGSVQLKQLAADGKVWAVVNGRNYRVVYILVGEAAGLSTKASPFSSEPTMIIDKTGARRRDGRSLSYTQRAETARRKIRYAGAPR